MAFEIDYAGLQQAMTHHDPYEALLYYLDTETGEVLVIDEWTEKQACELSNPDQAETPEMRLAWYILWYDGEPVGPELSEAEEEAMYERVEAFLERYIGVPTADSRESYQDMVDFAETVSDPHLQELLEVALQGKGAFRRFKDVLLSYPRERERWFEFKDRRLTERVNHWLRIHGLVPEEGIEEQRRGGAGVQGSVGDWEQGEPVEREGEPTEPEGVEEIVSEEAAGITILNFAHPLTPAQRQQIEKQTGESIGHIIDAPLQLDNEQPFEPQIRRHIDDLGPDSDALQAGGILVNPPGYAPAAAVLLAELHGRIGHFPAIVRIRPVAGSNPTRYEVAEVINLQAIRERSREER